MTWIRLPKSCNKRPEQWETTIDLPHMNLIIFPTHVQLALPLPLNTNCGFPLSAMLLARLTVTISHDNCFTIISSSSGECEGWNENGFRMDCLLTVICQVVAAIWILCNVQYVHYKFEGCYEKPKGCAVQVLYMTWLLLYITTVIVYLCCGTISQRILHHLVYHYNSWPYCK